MGEIVNLNETAEIVSSVEIELAEHAEAIRVLGRRMVKDAIEIGRRLGEAKKLVNHGKWEWWLESEFEWSKSTAERYMNIFDLSRKSVKLTDLGIPLSGVLLIARAPEEIQTEVIENAEQGEKMSVADVKKAIADANEAALKKTEQQIARIFPMNHRPAMPRRNWRLRAAGMRNWRN
jgi:hypothetical protein